MKTFAKVVNSALYVFKCWNGWQGRQRGLNSMAN